MTIKDFIQKAIEGGWENKLFWFKVKESEDSPVEIVDTSMNNINSILLDPLAWQAVGKVEGWEKKHYRGCEYKLRGQCTPICSEDSWTLYIHEMIDALCEGKTIEQYLETL